MNKDAVVGAAVGGGIGSLLGPHGTWVGGDIGVGAGVYLGKKMGFRPAKPTFLQRVWRWLVALK